MGEDAFEGVPAQGAEPIDVRVRRSLTKVVPMRISPEPWELLDRQAREPRTRPTTLLRMWLNGRLLAVTPVGAASAGSGLALLSPDEILRALDNAGLPDGTDRFMRELLVAIIRLIAAGESWEPARDTPGDAHPVG